MIKKLLEREINFVSYKTKVMDKCSTDHVAEEESEPLSYPCVMVEYFCPIDGNYYYGFVYGDDFE